MAGIELICVGELKFTELKGLAARYEKRIAAFVPFSLRRLKETKGPSERVVLERETRSILDHLKKDDYVIALHAAGKKMDSVGFAKFLGDRLLYGNRRLVFVIGGFAGFSEEMDQRSDQKLSFSDMTFSHDLFRVLFLEQLYRALTIIKGVPYHR